MTDKNKKNDVTTSNHVVDNQGNVNKGEEGKVEKTNKSTSVEPHPDNPNEDLKSTLEEFIGNMENWLSNDFDDLLGVFDFRVEKAREELMQSVADYLKKKSPDALLDFNVKSRRTIERFLKSSSESIGWAIVGAAVGVSVGAPFVLMGGLFQVLAAVRNREKKYGVPMRAIKNSIEYAKKIIDNTENAFDARGNFLLAIGNVKDILLEVKTIEDPQKFEEAIRKAEAKIEEAFKHLQTIDKEIKNYKENLDNLEDCTEQARNLKVDDLIEDKLRKELKVEEIEKKLKSTESKERKAKAKVDEGDTNSITELHEAQEEVKSITEKLNKAKVELKEAAEKAEDAKIFGVIEEKTWEQLLMAIKESAGLIELEKENEKFNSQAQALEGKIKQIKKLGSRKEEVLKEILLREDDVPLPSQSTCGNNEGEETDSPVDEGLGTDQNSKNPLGYKPDKTNPADLKKRPNKKQATALGQSQEEKQATGLGQNPEEKQATGLGQNPEEKQATGLGQNPEEKQATSLGQNPEEKQATGLGQNPEEKQATGLGQNPEEKQVTGLGQNPEEKTLTDAEQNSKEKTSTEAEQNPEEKNPTGLGQNPEEKYPTDAEQNPKEKYPTDAEQNPKEKYPTDAEQNPKEKYPTDAEQNPKEKYPTDAEQNPKEKYPTDAEQNPKEKHPTDAEQNPEEKHQTAPEQNPEEKNPTDPKKPSRIRGFFNKIKKSLSPKRERHSNNHGKKESVHFQKEKIKKDLENLDLKNQQQKKQIDDKITSGFQVKKHAPNPIKEKDSVTIKTGQTTSDGKQTSYPKAKEINKIINNKPRDSEVENYSSMSERNKSRLKKPKVLARKNQLPGGQKSISIPKQSPNNKQSPKNQLEFPNSNSKPNSSNKSNSNKYTIKTGKNTNAYRDKSGRSGGGSSTRKKRR